MFRFTRKPSSGSHSQYYTLGSMWIHGGRTGVVSVMAA